MLCERLDLIHLVEKYKFEFFGKLFRCENCIIDRCQYLIQRCKNFRQFYKSYDVYVDDKFCCSVVYSKFYEPLLNVCNQYLSCYVCIDAVICLMFHFHSFCLSVYLFVCLSVSCLVFLLLVHSATVMNTRLY